ncbi:uncharacterized, partial [Tachysurus ichikawai]
MMRLQRGTYTRREPVLQRRDGTEHGESRTRPAPLGEGIR